MSDMLITPTQLQMRLNEANCIIFDVRHDLSDHTAGRQQYEEAHIPGAIYLDHEQDLAAPRTGKNGRHPLPDLDDFRKLLAEVGLTADKLAVVYDDSGIFAAHLWWMLRWAGHNNTQLLDGGWQAWVNSGGPTESGQARSHKSKPDANAARATPSASPAMPLVNIDTVLANLHTNDLLVVDARAQARYRGEFEPMDPVAGHIPGAVNRPHQLNLQSDGRFKTAPQLREEFAALMGPYSPNQVVHQCGSGITACHNLFAMELAGLNGSKLYPGSWSEWCSDPTRPIA